MNTHRLPGRSGFLLTCICVFLLGSRYFDGFAAEGPVQWSVSSGGNGHWYEWVTDAPLPWEDAREQASQRPLAGHEGEAWVSYLATLTSAEEEEFVMQNVLGEDAPQKEYLGPWIGAFQPPGSPEPDGDWQWVSGEEWSYTNWYHGTQFSEPNNWGAEEDYCELWHNVSKYGLGWFDVTGDHPHTYLVEWEREGTPSADFAVVVGEGISSPGETVDIPVFLHFDYDGPPPPAGEIQGWSYGICHPDDKVEVVSVETELTNTAKLMGGVGPDFWSISLPEDLAPAPSNGITVGVVVDFQEQKGVTPRNGWLDVWIRYRVRSDAFPCGNPEESNVVSLTPCRSLGEPPVRIVATINETSLPAYETKEGRIEVVCSGDFAVLVGDAEAIPGQVAEVPVTLDFNHDGGDPPGAEEVDLVPHQPGHVGTVTVGVFTLFFEARTFLQKVNLAYKTLLVTGLDEFAQSSPG